MNPLIKKALRAYFANIGSKGGKTSKRVLTTEQARKMAALSHLSKSERIAIARKAGSAPKNKKRKK